MTRCYEFYVMVKRAINKNGKSIRTIVEKCRKSDAVASRILKYIEFMESKGVKFDSSKADKAHFKAFQKKFGSEGRVTQLANLQMKRMSKSDAIPKIDQKRALNENLTVKNCPSNSCSNELVLKHTFCPVCPKTCDGTEESCPVITFIKWYNRRINNVVN